MSDDDIDEKAEQRSQLWSSELDEDDTDAKDDQDDAGAQDAVDASDATSEAETAQTTDAEDDHSTMDAMDAVNDEGSDGAEDTTNASDAVDKESAEWAVESIRDAWTANSVRLPESIQEPFGTEYKRLDWQLEQADTDFELTKDRYYKPLVIALGLQRLQNCDADEVADLAEEMQQGTLLDDS